MMQTRYEQTLTTHQTERLTALLLDFFRDPKNENNWFNGAKIAINLVVQFSPKKAMALEKKYIFLASKLKNNITFLSLRNFAELCIEAADKAQIFTVKKNESQFLKNLNKNTQKCLLSALKMGVSEESALNRVAHDLVKQRRKLESLERLANMAKTHPLREALTTVENGQQLAKEDIRYHFLRLKRNSSNNKGDGVLFGLLEKAQSFSTYRLHMLLGDELFFLCRPLGFLGRNGTTLLVEVPTNAHLFALTWKKLEIIRALKKDAAFTDLKNIRFSVTYDAF
jgi:hypothetical protein